MPAAVVIADIRRNGVGKGIVTGVRHVVEHRVDYDLDAVFVRLVAHRGEIRLVAEGVLTVGVDLEVGGLIVYPPAALHGLALGGFLDRLDRGRLDRREALLSDLLHVVLDTLVAPVEALEDLRAGDGLGQTVVRADFFFRYSGDCLVSLCRRSREAANRHTGEKHTDRKNKARDFLVQLSHS